MPGMQLGKYRLIRQLAIGGMAEVYLARATGIQGFQKLVVLKRILPQYARDANYVQMFLDEARLAAMLHHPNIVQVFDIGAQIGNYYFAMEYVHGRDVREILSKASREQRPVPLGVAISIVQSVCRALHYAHDRCDDDGQPLGIVHRDVSPSNVQVTYDGGAKLLDFGVAKAATHERQTQAGSLKGKIAYMSPEQCLGEQLDRRSDVFAIGILLFEMTTGTRLFKGESELAILNKIAHGDAPSPATRRAEYPPVLEAIVMKALARDRAQRYQTAQDLERDLERFARSERLASSPLDVADFLAVLFPGEAREPTPIPRARAARGTPQGKHGRAATDHSDEPSILIVDGFDDASNARGELSMAAAMSIVAELPDDVLTAAEKPVPAPRSAVTSPTETLEPPRRRFGLTALGLALGVAAGIAIAFGMLGRGETTQPTPAILEPQAAPEPVPVPVPDLAIQPAPEPEPSVEPEPEPEPAPAPVVKRKRRAPPAAKKAVTEAAKHPPPPPAKKPKPKRSEWDPDSALLPEL